jgi:chromosome partitioning protein
MKQKTVIISVLNQKGGVGKTTSTINLAAYLGKQKRSVLVVDADPQGNATSGFGVDKTQINGTLCDVLVSHAKLNSVVRETNVENVFLIPTDARLASSELELADKKDRESRLKSSLVGLDYNYVLIDCPPALGLLTINALTASDFVLIPVQAEYYALEGLSQLLQVMQQVKQSYNPNLELLGVLMTMYDKRTSLAPQVHHEMQKHFSDKLFKTIIPRNVRLAEAPSHGLSISEYDRFSKGARAYKKLAKEIDKRVEELR